MVDTIIKVTDGAFMIPFFLIMVFIYEYQRREETDEVEIRNMKGNLMFCGDFLIVLLLINLTLEFTRRMMIFETTERTFPVFYAGFVLYFISRLTNIYFVKDIKDRERKKVLTKYRTSKDKEERLQYYRWNIRRFTSYIGFMVMIAATVIKLITRINFS